MVICGLSSEISHLLFFDGNLPGILTSITYLIEDCNRNEKLEKAESYNKNYRKRKANSQLRQNNPELISQ